MLIRRPIAEVFEAFVDPAITARFWFSRGDARLEAGKRLRWHWDMYGVSQEIEVKDLQTNRRILIRWPNGDSNPFQVGGCSRNCPARNLRQHPQQRVSSAPRKRNHPAGGRPEGSPWCWPDSRPAWSTASP